MSKYADILIKIMEDVQKGKVNLRGRSTNYLRDISIIKMLIRGKTLLYVGKQFDIGRERVRQIRNKYIRVYKRRVVIEERDKNV